MTMLRKLRWTVPTVCATAVLTACSLSPSTSSSSGDPNDTEFTAARQAAVADAVSVVSGALQAFGALAALTDARLDFDSGFGKFGTCPQVTFLSSTSGNATAQFDFATGCTAAATGQSQVSGTLDLTIGRSDGALRAVFDTLAFDGLTRTGTWDGTLQAPESGGALLDLTGRLDIQGGGRLEGTLQVELATGGLVTLGADNISIVGQRGRYGTTLTDVQADPLQYDSLLPVSGTARFVTSDLAIVEVGFTRRTAEQGVVLVTVGRGSAVNFTLPATTTP